MSYFTPPDIHNSARWKDLRVGLLGGSFDPPHEGHLHISKAALKALELDCIWWLLTPQNPLKTDSPAPLSERLDKCNALIGRPDILATDIEKKFGTQYTYDTIIALKKAFSDTHFVWINGMDNALNFHKWKNWKKILDEIPILHLRRASYNSVRNSPLKLYGKQRHVYIESAAPYALEPNTCFWMPSLETVNISSTALRKGIRQKRQKAL